jgi:hypothetical protein
MILHPPWIVKVKDFRLNSYAMPRITKDELYFCAAPASVRLRCSKYQNPRTLEFRVSLRADFPKDHQQNHPDDGKADRHAHEQQ